MPPLIITPMDEHRSGDEIQSVTICMKAEKITNIIFLQFLLPPLVVNMCRLVYLFFAIQDKQFENIN